MLVVTRFMRNFIFVSLSLLLCYPGLAFERVLYYDTFEEYDTRNGGFILPEGVERSRTKSRLFFTEREIEAPSAIGETRGLARYIPDPSGLSLVSLLLEDDDNEIGDGSLGADGSVSLWESIILDQGDRSGRAVISWMAVPFQNNETGGTMFPETDSRIDAGPEGLNLIGFGGVTREFDTGNPIPGQDFTGQLIINREGANLTDTGVGYQTNVPTFFVLDFDLETSLFDLIINGVVVEEDLPFFDVEGEAGKTLRELELISNARGLGTFVYDNLFQFDPDIEYQPVPYRTPVVADQAELIPLFMETFDDNDLGAFPESGDGDLFGSEFSVNGTFETVEDTTWQSPARGNLSADSTYTMFPSEMKDGNDPVRVSFGFTPTAGSSLAFQFGESTLATFNAGGVLNIHQDDANQNAATEHAVFENLPHWVTITLNPGLGMYFIKMYRATSPEDAETAVIDVQGNLQAQEAEAVSLTAEGSNVFLDELLLVELNETPEGEDENTQEVVFHQTNELRLTEAIDAEDPTQWSFNAFELAPNAELNMIDNTSLEDSARIAWTVIPNGNAVNHSLQITLEDGTEHSISAEVTADLTIRHNVVVVFDLTVGKYDVYVNDIHADSGLIGDTKASVSIQQAELLNTGNTGILVDDVIAVNDHYAFSFDPLEFVTPESPQNINLLFEEDYENNPARSELQVNEFAPRSSGLPIPTNSSGFSDLAETDIAGTRLTTGAPSADAAYIEDPDNSSLYSLFLGDRFAPQVVEGFEAAIPFSPISTFRTVPYAFVAPSLAVEPTLRYVTIRWSGRAQQANQTGLALFTQAEVTEVSAPGSPVNVLAPAGTPLAAFGDAGTILADGNGDGQLEDTGFVYEANQTYRFMVHVDQNQNTYDLLVNEEAVLDDAALPSGSAIGQTFGWFTTLVNDGNGVALQQSEVGGGKYVIDDIRVFESDEFTSVEAFELY